MKICILGPVMTEQYWGGVATFDEGLGLAFEALGHEVILVTAQTEYHRNTSLPIQHQKKTEIRRFLRQNHFELVIASLEYGRYLQSTDGCTTIYFLHGFFNFRSYGRMKTLAAVLYQKWLAGKADCVCANSSFTAAINRKIWNIPVDAVIHLGADEDYLQQIQAKPQIVNAANRVILFTGRLVEGKGCDKIIEAVASLNRKHAEYQLVIAGDGKQRGELESLAQDRKCNVCFLGRVEHAQMIDVYRNAEVFISLNETEPYGIVFVEALLAGCKIVCPATGGQVEFLREHADRVALLEQNDTAGIAAAIEQMMMCQCEPVDSQRMCEQFSYETTAKKILAIQQK